MFGDIQIELSTFIHHCYQHFQEASAYAQFFERGTKIVGVTSHYVNRKFDQGPIIFQDSFKVNPNDTLEKIKSKGQKLEAKRY